MPRTPQGHTIRYYLDSERCKTVHGTEGVVDGPCLINQWKRRYGFGGLAGLRGTIGDDELSCEGRHERLEVIEEWEYNVEMREAIRLASSLKDSLTERGTDVGSSRSPEIPPQEG